VLFRLSTLLSDVVRQSDFVARWGGEEFIVLLHEEDRAKAFLAADRIRTAIASTKIEIGLDQFINITASIGLAVANQTDPLNVTVANADSALYQSKASGRNRTTAFDPDQSVTVLGHLS
jgi:diguanylate cyclase (GGDEF)-like protein